MFICRQFDHDLGGLFERFINIHFLEPLALFSIKYVSVLLLYKSMRHKILDDQVTPRNLNVPLRLQWCIVVCIKQCPSVLCE